MFGVFLFLLVYVIGAESRKSEAAVRAVARMLMLLWSDLGWLLHTCSVLFCYWWKNGWGCLQTAISFWGAACILFSLLILQLSVLDFFLDLFCSELDILFVAICLMPAAEYDLFWCIFSVDFAIWSHMGLLGVMVYTSGFVPCEFGCEMSAIASSVGYPGDHVHQAVFVSC